MPETAGDEGATAATGTVLAVDDERNVLASLNRVLGRAGHQVITAQTGEAALSVLEAGHVDVIVTDLRMPGMDGLTLLERAYEAFPGVMRILITAFPDLDSTIGCINRAGIHHYLTKPWDDAELCASVERAVDAGRRHAAQRRLEAARGAEVAAHEQTLVRTQAQIAELFFDLSSLRRGDPVTFNRLTASQAQALAAALGLGARDGWVVYLAVLLREIDQVAVPDALLDKSHEAFTPAERRDVQRRLMLAHYSLSHVEGLDEASRLLHDAREHYDGSGPRGLAGEAIPLGARVLAVINGYVDAASPGETAGDGPAQAVLERDSGTRYDPRVVSVYRDLLRARHG